MRIFTPLGLIAVTALSGLLVAAGSGWYSGTGVGQARVDTENSGVTTRLLLDGLGTSSVVYDDTRLGYKAFGGYHFGRRFALEGGYVDAGKSSYLNTSVPAGTLRGVIRLQGWNLKAVGMLPLTGGPTSFPRAGVNYMETNVAFPGTRAADVLITNHHPHTANFKFGLGLQYDLIEALAVRAEVERFRIDDVTGNGGDINLLSLGFVYRPADATRPFGGARPSTWIAPLRR